MRWLIYMWFLVFAVPVSAQDAEITGVIDAQIEAFRADDFDRAFAYASPNIQQMFGSVARFEGMVKQGYPMVWRPADITYLELRDVAGRLWQRVMVTDADGAVHMLDYQMISTEMGWKINAVQLLHGADVNA